MPTDTPPVDPRIAALADLPLYTPTVYAVDDLGPELAARFRDYFGGPGRACVIRHSRFRPSEVVMYPEGSPDFGRRDELAAEMRACDEYLARRRAEGRAT